MGLLLISIWLYLINFCSVYYMHHFVLCVLKECPFVHKLHSVCQFPSSKMYESVELPSSKLPLLPVAERRYQRGSGLAALTSRVEILGSPIVPW